MSEYDEVFTGEFEYELKGNYKIPLKPADKSTNSNHAAAEIIARNNPPPPGTTDFALQINNTDGYVSPLAAVYSSTAKRPENSFQTKNETLFSRRKPAEPKPIVNANENATQQPGASRKRRSVMTEITEGLPAELIALLKPLCCDLCSTKLNSPSSAKLHYESKNHEKKINAWLSEWSTRTGEPMPKRQTLPKGPTGPNALHCDICDLALTSLQHAKQHYMGKKHRSVLAGRCKPGGAGYFDANNQWIRTSKVAELDPTNRFSIGESFLLRKENSNETVVVPDSVLQPPPPPPPLPECPRTPEPENDEFNNGEPQIDAFQVTSADLLPPPPPPPPPSTPPPPPPPPLDSSKYCKICDISVTSELHMRLHLNGAKHAKKLRQLGAPPYTETPDPISQTIMSITPNNNDRPIKRAKNVPSNECGGGSSSNGSSTKSDYSVYRTPSGQFYCQVCDITVTSEIMLSQHFGSKKHTKTAAASKRK